MGTDDGDIGSGLRMVAEQLHQASGRLERAVAEAQARTCTAAAPSGQAEVTADGRGRVVEVRLSTRRGRRTGLERELLATLNEALGRARTEANAAMTAALPASLREVKR